MPLSDAVERTEQAMRDAGEVQTASFGPVDQSEILRIVGLDPRSPIAHAVVAVARRYDLDPILGHISILPKSQLPYITRDGYLHIAHRSGQLDGIEVFDGPKRVGNEWQASVAVYRKDMGHPFIYPGRAAVSGQWGPEMAITRGERRALKRAFDVSTPGFADEDEAGPAVPALSSPQANDPAADSAAVPASLRPGVETLSEAQSRELWALWRRLGYQGSDDRRDERLNDLDSIIGHPVKSHRELTPNEARLAAGILRDRADEHDKRRDRESGQHDA